MKSDTDNKQNNKSKKPSRLRYIIATVIVLLCVLAGYIYIVITWESESKKISETVIRQTAAATLDKESNDLSNKDFTQITELKLHGKILYDIKLLEKFTNLEYLGLENLRYPMPKWMTLLAKLSVFEPEERFSIDLSPIEKLHNLHTLDLRTAQISDLEPIKGLKNLQYLYLDGNPVADVNAVKNLTNLQLLWLANTQVSDLEPIKGLTNLHSLGLSGTEVHDLEPIKGITSLLSIHIDGTRISDLGPIGGLMKLRNLELSNTQVSNLEPIKKLINLQELRLVNCQKITYEQVEDLQKALPELKIYR